MRRSHMAQGRVARTRVAIVEGSWAVTGAEEEEAAEEGSVGDSVDSGPGQEVVLGFGERRWFEWMDVGEVDG